MTALHARTFLAGDSCHNAYVLMVFGGELLPVEVGVDVALRWLDDQGYADHEHVYAHITHGGTALVLGGTE